MRKAKSGRNRFSVGDSGATALRRTVVGRGRTLRPRAPTRQRDNRFPDRLETNSTKARPVRAF